VREREHRIIHYSNIARIYWTRVIKVELIQVSVAKVVLKFRVGHKITVKLLSVNCEADLLVKLQRLMRCSQFVPSDLNVLYNNGLILDVKKT
jgi:hypothetical protein